MSQPSLFGTHRPISARLFVARWTCAGILVPLLLMGTVWMLSVFGGGEPSDLLLAIVLLVAIARLILGLLRSRSLGITVRLRRRFCWRSRCRSRSTRCC